MASRSPEATAPAGSGASPGGLGTAPRACVASHVPPVAITNPPVIFRMSRRDGIAPPKGSDHVFAGAGGTGHTYSKTWSDPDYCLWPLYTARQPHFPPHF